MPLEPAMVAPSRPWRWGAWLAWSLFLIAAFLAAAAAAFFIAWGDSTTCEGQPTQANLAQGQTHVLLAAGVLLAAWLLVSCLSLRRWALMLLGFLISATPLILLALTHTQPRDWTGGFCF